MIDVSTTMETFFRSYLEAALWAEVDDEGDALDGNYTINDISSDTLEEMRRHCLSFLYHPKVQSALKRCDHFHQTGAFATPDGCDVYDFAGYDFWMTRNGTGVGFWEPGDWPAYEGHALDQIAATFGCYCLYIGDDGMIHGS